MNAKRQVEVFNAGCPVCEEIIELINRLACDSCEVSVLDMHEPDVAERARSLGVRSIPAITVDGKLVTCCAAGGPDEASLRAAGIGTV